MQCVYIGWICQALCWLAQLFQWQCPTNSIPQTSYSTAILCLSADIAISLELAISHTSSTMKPPLIQSGCLFNPRGRPLANSSHLCTLSVCQYWPKIVLQTKWSNQQIAPNIVLHQIVDTYAHLACSIHSSSLGSSPS